MFFFFLTTVCVKLLGLYLLLYMFCCMRASVSGLMALLVLWFFPLNIFIHSFIQLLSLVVFGRTCVQKERQGLVLIAYIHGCFMRFNFFVFYSTALC